jgi:hypothetical protein
MKQLLFSALALVLLVGFATSLEAAQCDVVGFSAPAASVDGSAPQAASGEVVVVADAQVVGLSQEPAEVFDFELCRFWACIQTPTGCGCAGFYCNGHFICGYRIK